MTMRQNRSWTMTGLAALATLGGIACSGSAQAATQQQIKSKVAEFYNEVFNKRDLNAIGDYIAPNGVDHTPMPGQRPGLNGLKEVFSSLFVAFPDLHYTVDDVLVDGDRVAVRYTWTGTQQGAFQGIAASGRHVRMNGVDILTLKNGKLTDRWGYENDAVLLQQLGVSPSGSEAAAASPVVAPPAPAENVTTTASGLQYVDYVVGTGDSPKPGQTVTVSYVGSLTDGTEFDNSLKHGGTFSFPIGMGQVIKGWDEGVMGMKVGGRRKLIVPPGLGYGAAGAGGVIPPNATLIFVVELLGVKDAAPAAPNP